MIQRFKDFFRKKQKPIENKKGVQYKEITNKEYISKTKGSFTGITTNAGKDDGTNKEVWNKKEIKAIRRLVDTTINNVKELNRWKHYKYHLNFGFTAVIKSHWYDKREVSGELIKMEDEWYYIGMSEHNMAYTGKHTSRLVAPKFHLRFFECDSFEGLLNCLESEIVKSK